MITKDPMSRADVKSVALEIGTVVSEGKETAIFKRSTAKVVVVMAVGRGGGISLMV